MAIRRACRRALARVLLAPVLGAGLAVEAGTPPPGFVETPVVAADAATGALSPTGVAYEPQSGHLWVIEKGGSGSARVRRRAAASGTVTTALTLACVDSAGERGLLGIAFSPSFAADRWVYLYYTRSVTASGACAIAGQPAGSRNRVSRFRESGGTLSGEQVVLDGPYLTSATNHNGGAIRFAPDGTLFVAMGDNDTDGSANPLSRDLGDLRGKLLRIRPDGSIPADNPFVGDPGVRGEIWAWGLRNPWRFDVDPSSGLPWIGDVGERTWEAVYVGLAGADYGYPCFEGSAPFRSCNPQPPPGSVTDPVYVYGHGSQTPPVSGGSITGGPVYRHTAFPSEYRDNYYFADYVAGWIRRGRVTAGNGLTDIQMFVPDAASVVDLVVSPAGCLTWVGIAGAGVREICPVASPNSAPLPQAEASYVAGPAPVNVQFTGSMSTDPDGDPLTYLWDFGDGGSSNLADPVHLYVADGVYQAVLTIDDGRGQPNSSASSGPLRIVVGNRLPQPAIDLPRPGSRYIAGDTVDFAGRATDPEEGSLAAAQLSWLIEFHHAGHRHPFLGPLTGIDAGSFQIPASGEDATDVFYRIYLTATDTGVPLGPGAEMSTTVFVDLLPTVTTQTLLAVPFVGLQLTFEQQPGVTPLDRESVAGFARSIGAPSPQTVGGRTFVFDRWSDGGAASHDIVAAPVDSTHVAWFVCTANCQGLDVDLDGDGFTALDGDCDDGDSRVYLDAPDLCDGVDNDCDGRADDGRCDEFDATGDLRMNGIDLALLGRAFGLCDPAWSAVDFTRDGCVDGKDLAVMAAVWGCAGTTRVCN